MFGNTNLLNRAGPRRAEPARSSSCPIDLSAMLPHNLCRNHYHNLRPRTDFTAMLPHNLLHRARNNNTPSSSIQAPSRDDQIPSPHNSFPSLPHLQVIRLQPQPEDDHSDHDHSSFANYGLDELDDPHRDMRLDIDSMSNEELLALEERIEYVSTGLSDQVKINKQTKRERASSSQDLCCICQDDYIARGYTQKLDCGHGFHPGCIKQWLRVKNVCPLCKIRVCT